MLGFALKYFNHEISYARTKAIFLTFHQMFDNEDLQFRGTS